MLVDTSGSAVGLTLYNLAQTTHLSVGDIIAIPDPLLRFTQVQDKASLIIIKKNFIEVSSEVQTY